MERERKGEDTAGRSNNGCWDLFSMWLISNRLNWIFTCRQKKEEEKKRGGQRRRETTEKT